jgi:hypothetical protein
MVFVVGWLCVAFFGLGGVMGVRRLFDRREQLRIGSAGIRVARGSEQTIPWSEIVDVTTWSYKGQKAIALHLRDKARFPGQGMAALLASLGHNTAGGDIAISLAGTNRQFEEALSAMAHFRSRTA